MCYQVPGTRYQLLDLPRRLANKSEWLSDSTARMIVNRIIATAYVAMHHVAILWQCIVVRFSTGYLVTGTLPPLTIWIASSDTSTGYLVPGTLVVCSYGIMIVFHEYQVPGTWYQVPGYGKHGLCACCEVILLVILFFTRGTAWYQVLVPGTMVPEYRYRYRWLAFVNIFFIPWWVW